MGKPLREDFEAVFAMEEIEAAKYLYVEFEERWPKYSETPAPREEIEDCLRTAIERAAEHFDLLEANWRNTKVIHWLANDPGALSAIKLLRKTRRAPKPHDETPSGKSYVDSLINRFFANAHRPNAYRRIEKRVFGWQLDQTWTSSVVRALHEYFYTDKAERLWRTARDAEKILRPFEILVEEFSQLISEIDGDDFALQKNALRKISVARVRSAIEAGLFKRDSRHKREILFVHRLWAANLQHFRKPSPECIAELMTLDGFDHQFDLRTIERMCAKLKAAKDSKSAAKVAGAKPSS